MRKKAIFAITAVLFLFLSGYILFQFIYYYLADMPDKYTNSWETVRVEGVGVFKVPEEWQVENQNGILYIANNSDNEQGDTPFLIGTILTSKNNEKKTIHPHELLNGVQKGNHISSINYSNGARMSLFEYYVNGKIEEHYLITISNFAVTPSARFELLIWNTRGVDERLIRQIAKTFSLCKTQGDGSVVTQV